MAKELFIIRSDTEKKLRYGKGITKRVYLGYNKKTNKFKQMADQNYVKEYLLIFNNKDLAEAYCKDLNDAVNGDATKGNIFYGLKHCKAWPLYWYSFHFGERVIGKDCSDYKVQPYKTKNKLVAQFPGIYMVEKKSGEL